MVNNSTNIDQFVIIEFSELQLLNKKKDWKGPYFGKYGVTRYVTNNKGGSFKVTKSNGKIRTYKTISSSSALFVAEHNVHFIR